MLNFIYYPVSFILWAWHKAFSFVLGDGGWAGGISWALAVVFLVFTLRAFLYKPFVSQVRSMRKMQEFQPEIAKLRKKYANDKQKQAAEMQRLQKEHGVNPVAGCLPVLVQLPVFIGLFHVLRSFGPINDQGVPINLDGSVRTQNYFFDQAGVLSFNNASLFGAKLGSWVTQGSELLEEAGTSMTNMIIVMIPLMIAAGVFTHITARHSVARQIASGQGMDNPQTAIMQKLMLYVFPIGVVVGAPFLPLAILIYWVSNNLWTLGQQYVVYRRIDAEQAEKKEQTVANRQALAPRPGQKPVRPEPKPTEPPAKKPGAKPVTRKQTSAARHRTSTNGVASTNGTAKNRTTATTARHAGAGSGSAGSTPARAAPGSAAEPADHPRPPASAAAAATPHHPRRRRIVPKTAQEGQTGGEDQLVREGDIAGDYLERLLDLLDYDGDIDLDVEAGRAIVSIDGGEDLDRLVGDRGAVLEALQELTRLAVQQIVGQSQQAHARHRGLAAGPSRRAHRAGSAHRQGGAGKRRVGADAADDAVRAQGRARRRGAGEGRVERERG